MKSCPKHFDIIIIGGGVVGLTAALSCNRNGFKVALIDNKPKPSLEYGEPYDVRVFAITRLSQNLFRELEVWDEIKNSRLCPYTNMHVWDSTGGGDIKFNALDIGEDDLGHIIEQKVILRALVKEIDGQKNITCHFGSNIADIIVDEDRAAVTLQDGNILVCKLLVGADGANSYVRNHFGINVNSRSYGHHALVATIKGSEQHHNTARQRFESSGPLALLPLPHPNYCSIVWSVTEDYNKYLLNLSAEKFNREITHTSEGVIGDITLESDRFVFPLIMRQSNNYASHRLALVGDAAHTIHPLAGLGVNCGLEDVVSLINALKDANSRGRDIGHENVTKKYHRERKTAMQSVLFMMDAFKYGFESSNSLVRRVRNHGLNFANKNSMLKNFFINFAMGN